MSQREQELNAAGEEAQDSHLTEEIPRFKKLLEQCETKLAHTLKESMDSKQSFLVSKLLREATSDVEEVQATLE